MVKSKRGGSVGTTNGASPYLRRILGSAKSACIGRLLNRQAGNVATANEPALLIGGRSQSSKILTPLKEMFVVEPAKIGFDEALLRGACTLDPDIEGTVVCQVPGSKESYGVGNPFHSAFNKIEVFFGEIA